MKTSYWTTLLFASALAIGCSSNAKKESCSDCMRDGDVEDTMKMTGHHEMGDQVDDKHDANDKKDEKEDKDDKIDVAALPAVVLTAFNTAHPGATIKEIEKDNENGVTHYDIEYTDATGDHKVELDDKGAVVPE